MSYHLVNSERELHFSTTSWQMLLNLAVAYGWQPGKAELVKYLSNDGFQVMALDALALAQALERALPDIPAHDATQHHPTLKHGIIPDNLEGISSLEWLSRTRDNLYKFIELCREGSFSVS